MSDNPYKPGYKKKRDEKDIKSLKSDMNFLSGGLNILVCFLLCGGIGYFIDKRYGTEVWTERGAIFGLIVGLYYFVKLIIDAFKNK